MVGSLIHLKLRLQHRIIQGSGNLTDSSSIAVYHLSAFIGGRQPIAVLCRKRHHCRSHGVTLPGQKKRPVDLRCSGSNILSPGR